MRKLDSKYRTRNLCRSRGIRGLACASCFTIATSAAGAAWAQDPELSRTSPGALGLGLVGATALVSISLLLPAPQSCRWCQPPSFDETLARRLSASDRRAAATWSDALSFVVIPIGSVSALLIPPLTTAAPNRQALENVSIALEAVFLDVALTQITKKTVARKRPAFYYERVAATEYAERPNQENVAFFSGHTSVAFAAASAAATVSFQRGYPGAPYVAAAGGGLALSSALLRVAADVHWPSDVFTGAVVGTGVGLLVPLLLHPRKSEQAIGSVAPPLAGPEPALLSLAGKF